MGSSLCPLPPFLSAHNPRLLPSHGFSLVGSSSSSSPFLNFRISRRPTLCLSAFAEKKLEISWLNQDLNTNDEFGGWAVFETEIEEKKKENKVGLRLLVMGTGVSALIFVAVIAFSSSSRKGFKLKPNWPSISLQRLLTPFDSTTSGSGSSDSSGANVDYVDVETVPEFSEKKININASESVKKPPKLVITTVAADSTQEEALQSLKKLKIVEDDVSSDALCTRREYARWLVKANSALERNPKHRISILPSGSFVQAFDDVTTDDPDFPFIQALAEAGIVRSKLSDNNTSSGVNDLKVKEMLDFRPESYISRLDLINWKSQLEYVRMSRIQEISSNKVSFMDVNKINPEASSEFFMDMLAGDKSILRKVFGQSRRFQPQKPATKAQAAVALTSGRMAKTIRVELSRLEIENLAMLAEMKDIRSELLRQGDVQRFWEEKFNEVKAYGEEVARHFDLAISDLEQEKSILDKSINENMKERVALDCQRKLLVNLKEEISEMSEKLASESASFATEQKNLDDMFVDLYGKQEAITETKSILEAEKEALRMLRTWVEDEARRNQARAKVLEQVGRRWRWNEGT